MLQLPSLDIVFSSRRPEENSAEENDVKMAVDGLRYEFFFRYERIFNFPPFSI
jgi:hypothetical protein